jgi:hypothetical protein
MDVDCSEVSKAFLLERYGELLDIPLVKEYLCLTLKATMVKFRDRIAMYMNLKKKIISWEPCVIGKPENRETHYKRKSFPLRVQTSSRLRISLYLIPAGTTKTAQTKRTSTISLAVCSVPRRLRNPYSNTTLPA